MKKKEKEELRCELDLYQQQGVELWLDGQPSTPKSILKAHKIAEDGVYMRDYVRGKTGEVEHVSFDLVKDR